MIALLLALALAEEPPAAPTADGETVLALVAARDLYPGVEITDGDVYAVELPTELVPPGVRLLPGEIVGKKPIQRILANEFFVDARMSHRLPTVPVEIPAGHRMVPLDRAPGKSKPRATVDLWRQEGPERCLLVADLTVGAVDPMAVVLPEAQIATVLEADARGALLAASPDSLRGAPCSD